MRVKYASLQREDRNITRASWKPGKRKTAVKDNMAKSEFEHLRKFIQRK